MGPATCVACVCNIERHVYNAQRVAEYLSKHPKVAWAHYPGQAVIFEKSPYTKNYVKKRFLKQETFLYLHLLDGLHVIDGVVAAVDKEPVAVDIDLGG